MSARNGSYLITGFILLSFFALFPGPGSEEAALRGPESSPQEGLQHDVTASWSKSMSPMQKAGP